MKNELKSKIKRIANSGLTIYDIIDVGDEKLWLTSKELEANLNHKIVGHSLKGLALRSRSKVVKEIICSSLGYPVPKSFKKTQPRFLGQNFDVYTQKSNNLQVWNEELDLSRRYVLIRVSSGDIISRVKVITGAELAPLDTTGTLTQKYQAQLKNVNLKFELVSKEDNLNILTLLGEEEQIKLKRNDPALDPIKDEVLPIEIVFERLKNIVGSKFADPGIDQERNRGAELHKLVCRALGYNSYKDNGQFPDVRNQLLEIKLQTSATIDLGLVTPDSEVALDMTKINGINIKHCDIRYAIFYGKTENGKVTITNLILTTGKDFFSRCPRFEGKGLNKKIQIPLPKDFFAG